MPRYLPSLSTLISLGNLPESLGFLQDTIDSVFDDIYFDHYVVNSSKYGEEKTFNLDIVLEKELGFNIPGTGLSLLLNPSEIDGSQGKTSFNVSLYYRLGILRFINNFSISNFSFKQEDLISLLLDICSVEPVNVLEYIASLIKNPDGRSLSYIIYTEEELVDFFNSYYDLTGTDNELVYEPGTSYGDIEGGLANAGITTADVTNEFGISTDYPLGEDTIEDVYSRLDIEKDTSSLSISDLIDILNTNYSLTGTPDEILYTADPETSYEDILEALSNAHIGLLNLIIDYVIRDNTSFNDIEQVLIDFFTELQENYSFGVEFYGLFNPVIQTSINNLNLAIKFPRSALQPIDPKTNEPYADQSIESMLRFNVGALSFSSTDGFEFENESSFSFSKSEIANTGLVLGFTGAKLDLSTTTNIPEADAAGYPVDFVGVYVKEAIISFSKFGKDDPEKVSATITADDLLIGTGGISGKIALETDGILYRKFGNFAIELNAFSITFRQNAILNSDIKGKLTIGGFKAGSEPAVIDIEAHIHDNGDFSITAVPKSDLLTITLPNVLEIVIRSIELGKEDRGFYIEVAGQLDFIADLPVLGEVLPKGVDIKKLRIWDNGDLEFKGGGLEVPKAFSLSVGPVKMEVSHIAIGSYNRKLQDIDRRYQYFGFDGMINTHRAGVVASGNGIKFYYTVDTNDTDRPFNSFVSIDGIAIDILIPEGASEADAAFILKGFLSMSTPDPTIVGSNAGSEYTGSVTFSIPKFHLTGSAKMRIQPDIPAFVVDIGMELTTSVPLGGTGLGIYGFRGLIGEHYLPSKSATKPPVPETGSWWDYYKVKSTITKKEGIEIDKFSEKPGYSIGAGVSIATAFDSGKIFSSKLFLLLGLPDVFLIQGQAGLLRERIGLADTSDPPFSAFIAIDKSSFRGNLSVDYKLPDDGTFEGDIFSVNGTLDMAFFFNNASGWYLNVGKDQPESARVRAKILTLFQGYAYLMISSKGFKAGAGAKFDFNKSFGPVGVGIGAALDLAGSVSFKPVQIGAMIQFGGYAYIKVFSFKISLSVQISLAVEAPHPFNITGALEIKMKLAFFFTLKFRLEVSWHINNNNSVLLEPVPVLGLPDPATGYQPASATNILSNDIFELNYINHEISGSSAIPAPGDSGWQYNFNDADAVMNVTIPLDSYIDIELLKPVKPAVLKLGGAGNQLPDGYTELAPPQKGISNQVKHEYQLTGLEIYAWHDTGAGSGSWVPYNVYEAVTAIVLENAGAINLSTLKEGYWQFAETNKYNKIRLLSQNMFSYVNQSTSGYSGLDALNFQRKDLFCFENVVKKAVINWIAEPLDTTYAQGAVSVIQGVSFTFNGISGSVKNDASFGNKSLYIDVTGGAIVISLPKPVTTLNLDFGENNNDIQIDFIKKITKPGIFGQTRTIDTYMNPAFLLKTQQNTSIQYNDLNNPVEKVSVRINPDKYVDYEGDLVIGGYFALADQYITVSNLLSVHEEEMEKALFFVTLFNRSFTVAEVLAETYRSPSGAIGQWPLDSANDSIGTHSGILAGSPDLVPGFYETNGDQQQLHNIYSYSSNTDALFVPFAPELKVESGSFAFEVSAVFSPYSAGISTLLYKVKTDPITGYKKGFALHLYQDTPGDESADYSANASVPSFSIWLTSYQGTESSGIKVSEKYSVDCTTAKLTERQCKHILVSVNRSTGKIDIFIDKELKTSVDIPAELSPFVIRPSFTWLNQLSYLTEVLQRRQEENGTTKDQLIEEIQLIGDSLNKTIQPVWRPETTYAVTVKTRDVVNGNTSGSVEVTRIFGFKTAGPIGHFQQQSIAYKELVAEDRAAEFKLANLQHYIDYERSFPDAQSRYDLSKPVLYHNPKVSLFFIKPYINAMFANWDSYLGLPAVKSSLQLQVFDPFGVPVTPELVWEQLPDLEIDINNFRMLPPDQQILFLMNFAASADACNENPLVIKKRTKKGSYQLPDLQANRLYTALFTAVYQPDGEAEQQSEVHKFSFKTSLFASFEEQVKSFILSDIAGNEQYAVYPVNVGFTADEIEQTLKTLIDDDVQNDPSAVFQYAVKFDRLVYAGLKLKNIVPAEGTVINLVININPADPGDKKILGILIRNPEAFNDPKLDPVLLADTIGLTLTALDNTVIGAEQFIYIHSRDTSSVFITNTAMNIPAGNIQLSFRHKIFNGNDYETEHEDYISPGIPISL